MTVREGLEADLRAHPEDWRSWLVYADWLTEQGDRRGKLVHLEHQLATAALSKDDRTELEWDIRRLRERWGEQWALPPEDAYASQGTWRHGFLMKMTRPKTRDLRGCEIRL